MRKLETIRADLSAAQQQLSDLESPTLLIPLTEALAAVDAFIGACANRAREYLRKTSAAFSHRAGYQPRIIDPDVYTQVHAVERMQDVVALIAPDALRAELTEALHQHYAGDASQMAEPERARAALELRKKIDRLEQEEYAACVATGTPIRAGTRPELLLGLETL